MNATAPSSPSDVTAESRRILVVDDHPVFRHGILALVRAEPDLAVCGEAGSSPDALEIMRSSQPDAAVVDISLPGPSGVELVKMMKAEQPRLAILVLSMHDESIYALRALRAGALGYVMKGEGAGEVVDGLRKVLRGEVFLSRRFADRLIMRTIQCRAGGQGSPVDALSARELEVMEWLGRGLGTRETAERLRISVKTAETHRARIKEKLGFSDSPDLLRFAADWVRLGELSGSDGDDSSPPAK